MVRLKNLKRNKNIGECDIIPEDSIHAGHIIVDLDLKELKEYSLPAGYEWCVNHAYHAGRNLVTLLLDGQMPEEYVVMWN